MAYWRNQRGLTIIEMVAVAVIISIVSTMGLFVVKDTKRKNLRTEAKLNLQALHIQQKREKFENGYFHSDIRRLLNPQGILRYNIGFIDLTSKDEIVYRDAGSSFISDGNNNLYEFCGEEFKSEEVGGTVKSSFCAFRVSDDSAGFTPPEITFTDAKVEPQSSSAPSTPPPPSSIKYKAYAIGNLFEEDNNPPPPPNSEYFDIWSVNESGVLDNCRSPWDDDDTC